MAERDAIELNLGDGFLLIAAGIRREKNGEVRADLMLQNGRILHADRAVLNTEDGRAAWAAKATAEDRPTAARMAEAIREFLLPDALAALQEEPKKPTQAEALVGMVVGTGEDFAADVADAVELFHDPNGDAYATVPIDGHRVTLSLRTKAFRQWLARRFHEQHGKTPSGQALVDATNVLAGKALYNGPEHRVHLRLAEHEGTVYLDLGNATREAVAVDAAGWRVVSNPPVKFRRPRGMQALPYPAAGGDLGALRRFVNVADDQDFRLIVAWLVGAFRPNGPYPALVVHGEQGSAKSTLTRLLRSLIDPNAAPIRAMPRDERDLMIAAVNGWALAFDNISHLPDWLSDGLCRLSTGGGFATRQLYEDQDEVILEAQRPLLLNGIEEIASRGDLLDRSIVPYLPTIPEDRRRAEQAFWRAFEDARPAILGALLDAASAAVRNLPTTELDTLPRMADFALWVSAAEPALGWAPGAFMEAYRGNRAAANDLTLEASPVSPVLRDFVGGLSESWSGTATELLKRLNERVDEATRKQKGWPANGRSLSNALRRLGPNLRAARVAITFDLREAGTGKRTLKLEQVPDPASPASQPSRVVVDPDQAAADRDARDARDAGSQDYSIEDMFADDADLFAPRCNACDVPLPPGARYVCADCDPYQ